MYTFALMIALVCVCVCVFVLAFSRACVLLLVVDK